MSAVRGLVTAKWMAHHGGDVKEICRNPDISKASTSFSSEMKLAPGRKSDDYLTGHGEPWISGAHSSIEIRDTRLGKKSH